MYISESETPRGRAGTWRQKPGACPDERCHNAFFVGDDAPGRRMKGPLTSWVDVMIACWSADVAPVITELISQFTGTRGRAGVRGRSATAGAWLAPIQPPAAAAAA